MVWYPYATGLAQSNAHDLSASCTTCNLLDVPSGSSFDASRVFPLIIGSCLCTVPTQPLFVDVGTASATTRPDIVNFLRFPKKLKGQPRAIGFDPNPNNCRSMKPVLAPFGERARFKCAAVSDHVGSVNMDMHGAEGATVHDAGALGIRVASWAKTSSEASVRVRMTTLDIEVPTGENIFLLKLDTQGHEVHVLRGAERLFREQRISWVIVEFDIFALKAASAPDRPSSGHHLLSLLAANDFSCINLRYKTWKRMHTYRCPDPQQPRLANRTCGYSDLLCAHKRVAMGPEGWMESITKEFCSQPGWERAGVCWSV